MMLEPVGQQGCWEALGGATVKARPPHTREANAESIESTLLVSLSADDALKELLRAATREA